MWPSYQLIQVKDMFLDSCLIAQIFRKGHDVTKADIQHVWEGLVKKVDRVPFDEIYQRLDAKRKGKTSKEDFSQLTAQMAEMAIRVSGRQQESVGENALP